MPAETGNAQPTPSPPASEPHPGLWEALGWRPDPQQWTLFQQLQQELRHWNGRLNLTRLVEGDDYWVTQVFDSLWPLRERLNDPEAAPECIDVGTGGGFPGLAVAIALPNARLTLVDSVGRKTEAVRAMAAALGLADRVRLRCERVERTGQERACRGHFDLALARAVATAPVVAEYLLPLLRPQGRALLYRGQWSHDDAEALERALLPLSGRLERVQRQDLPGERGVRHAITLVAMAPCPRTYPRAVGVPAKHPLGSINGG
ncbi:16S rRNA (guanine(527)-N(7))-methyltransferase RsmG [Cyanobium sp. Morenito 9A2]|uniref:16S rRNA (guanine(527)-N(7))-methyltransferase RsmG n=1 Tax=Cyanobium sp. Morenito 9A2 TaxID=2823718 RepID=UPI0020CEDC2F|nr:16S rRNA (guanine(527)-N(7))-methyltransferase RsmG [Cyanobium sp. Morenito 9A2]MCP9849166.1 16S rRNA (guanine(527)-N(7))-methyltransferase RsmG [Cyanobium sp. Morenito 9A2]